MAVSQIYGVNPTDGGVGKGAMREDLSNIIYRIAPEETPFISNIGRETVSSTYHEWQEDTLAAANTANAIEEGKDADDSAFIKPDRVGNYTQISQKTVNVSMTSQAVDLAGMRTLMDYERAKKGKELRLDMEAIMLSNQAASAGAAGVSAAGTNTNARKLAGFPTWIKTNIVANGRTAPTMSSGAGSGYPNAGWTAAGTPAAFSEANLKAIALSMFNARNKIAPMVMTNGANKVLFSGFAGIAVNRFELDRVGMGKIIGAADVYQSDFGVMTAVPNVYMPTGFAYFIDPEYAKVGYLRPFKSTPLAKTGDSMREQLIVEYTLVVSNEKAHGVAAGLNA
jgi:hypothetical protein